MTKTKKFLIIILTALFALLLSLSVKVFANSSQPAEAYTMGSGYTCLGNIYNDAGGYFNKNVLDTIGSMAGCTDAQKMNKYYGNRYGYLGSQFDGYTVKFGSYTFNGRTYELEWIPIFACSRLENGKATGTAVLVLWLAYTASSNGTYSNQEVSAWSDGTYHKNNTVAYSANGNTYNVHSNTYDSSYIRNYVLNGGDTNYAKNFGTGSTHSVPAKNTMTKFSRLNDGGDLSPYIVGVNGTSTLIDSSANGGSAANDPNTWANDKVWLPSTNIINGTDNQKNGANDAWLRNAHSGTSYYHEASKLYKGNVGSSSSYYATVNTSLAVRPCIAINLDAALGNTCVWDSGKITTPATCSAEGVKTFTCAVCGETKTETIPVDANAHNYSVITTPATCTTAGVKTFTCLNNSSHSYTQPLSALGHNWDTTGTVTTPATCTTAGVMTYTCKNDANHTQTLPINPTGHSWDTGTVTTPATCTADGVKTFTCLNNSAHSYTQKINMLGHNWNSGTVTTQPTCTVDGEKTFTCNNNSTHTYTQAVPAKGHTVVNDLEVAPTCTVAGKTAGSHCSVCNTVITAQTAVAAKGHTPITLSAIPATCTDDGKTSGIKCSTCNDILTPQTTVPATGHSYNSVVIPPTASQVGYTIYTCLKCGSSYNDDYVPALGHTYQAGAVTAPTCTDRGYTTYICSDCGDSYPSDFTAPLGHDYQFVKVVAATCPDQGYTLYACSRCDAERKLNYTAATGHSYKLELSVNADGYSVTAKLVCQNCGEWRILDPDEMTVVPGTNGEGKPTKTVTVVIDGEPVSETIEVDRPDPIAVNGSWYTGGNIPQFISSYSDQVFVTYYNSNGKTVTKFKAGSTYKAVITLKDDYNYYFAEGVETQKTFTAQQDETITPDPDNPNYPDGTGDGDNDPDDGDDGNGGNGGDNTGNGDGNGGDNTGNGGNNSGDGDGNGGDNTGNGGNNSGNGDGKNPTGGDNNGDNSGNGGNNGDTSDVGDIGNVGNGGELSDGDGFPWWIFLIIGLFLLFLVIIIIVLVNRQRKIEVYEDYYDDEYYDDEEDEEDEDEEEDDGEVTEEEY